MAYIKGISYYLPEKVMTNEELVQEFPEWSVDKVAKKVGVYSRHLAAEDENKERFSSYFIKTDVYKKIHNFSL